MQVKIESAIAAERERCARIADEVAALNVNTGDGDSDAEHIAARIRSGE